ncbi:hypothetical protein Syun_014722 [Stephania yunnanensis]|uniref:Uncharacterized protein n=1 Tax=Stephania yunnanensis TaxID=152371 RepID=A0AAP0JM72_9MAGN
MSFAFTTTGYDGGNIPLLRTLKYLNLELVVQFVEVVHPDFAEVVGVALVEEDSVVVHASGIVTAAWVLLVLTDVVVDGAHMLALLPVPL